MVKIVSRIDLGRFLRPEYKEGRYIASCLTFGLLVVPRRYITQDAPPHVQLVQVMKLLKEQYDAWLTNPNLPTANLRSHPPFSTVVNPHGLFVSNIGVMDNYLGTTWPPGSTTPRLEVQEVMLGHRLAEVQRM